MKKVFKAVKVAAVLLMVAGLSACATQTAKDNADWKGKVWRGPVLVQFVDSRGKMSSGEKVDKAMNFDPKRDDAMRIARIQFNSGWDSVIVNALVPDQIEFSQITKGTLVDVMVEQGATSDFNTSRMTRILRVVCDAKDNECVSKEIKAKRNRAVVDATPPLNISEIYGVTYKRRITDEEAKLYD